MTTCNRCGLEFADEDLRPYDHGGALICFDCGQADPETKAVVERNMANAINAINGPIVLTAFGPRGVHTH